MKDKLGPFFGFLFACSIALIVIGAQNYIIAPFAKASVSSQEKTSAVSEYIENRNTHEFLACSTYWVRVRTFVVSVPDSIAERLHGKTSGLCNEGYGTAWTIDSRGYFATNNHVVDVEKFQKECLSAIAKKGNIPISEFFGVQMKTDITLSGPDKFLFKAKVLKTWKNPDIGFLEVDRDYLARLQAKLGDEYVKPDFIPLPFRTASPVIKNGIVSEGKGMIVLPDEPIAVLGNPLALPFVLVRGKLGTGTFWEMGQDGKKEVFVHLVAPLNHGSSGSAILSLLDMKVIGMDSINKSDVGQISAHHGMVPFWTIMEKMKEAGLK